MTAKPKSVARPSVPPSDTPLSWQEWELRKAALRLAIDSGAKTNDVVPVAAKIEEYIRNGQAKS